MTAAADIDTTLDLVRVEIYRAIAKHDQMCCPHQGYAVILEEMDELWVEVKQDQGRGADAQAEAIQIAAMAVRYVVDLIEANG